MRFFFKLNGISALYGFLFFLITRILVSPYTITEWLKISLDALTFGVVFLTLAGAILLALLIPKITDKWMEGRPATLWATILWFPYWLFFVLFFAYVFPGQHPYEDDNYGAAFLILGLMFVYPFYLALTTAWGLRNKSS